MSVLHLWPEEPRRKTDGIELSASIEIPGRKRLILWYKLPENRLSLVPPTSDHFVLGTIFLLMQIGGDVHVHGQVSPSLLRNLNEFQAAWKAMKPDLTCVDIRADLEREVVPAPDRDRAILTFSGGVDSCFTAYRHTRADGTRFQRNLSAGVMVHGFDIPLSDMEAFAAAAARSERMLKSLGLELITIATNYREIDADWTCSHGAAIASCLHLFSTSFAEGLIGQTFTYGELRYITEGVNALTDPLLSSDFFRIVPDGAAYKRSEKILTLSGWNEFLTDLRVCWEGPQKDRNCCACEKCMRNILTFRALGLGLPACFEHDIDDLQVRTLRLGDPFRADIRYGGLIKLADARGVTGPWLDILRKRLAAQRRAERSKALRLYRRFRSLASRLLGRIRKFRT
jgi:hypothetical protein